MLSMLYNTLLTKVYFATVRLIPLSLLTLHSQVYTL